MSCAPRSGAGQRVPVLADPEPPLGAVSAVYRWADLPEPVREWWARADQAATAVQQMLGHADAFAAALGSNRVHVAVHRGLLGAFRLDDGRASCVFAGRPVLGGPPGSQLRELAELVRADAELTTAPASGAEAVAVLDTIERRSWKARCDQSMHDRDQQFELYSGLLDRNLVTLDVAWHGRRPVAYRLDARVGQTVACVKWSFDEDYRRCSPGFYLLTQGLVRRWGPVELDLIDLFGSPDTLKDVVASGAVPRYDLAWPPRTADGLTCWARRLRWPRHAPSRPPGGVVVCSGVVRLIGCPHRRTGQH